MNYMFFDCSSLEKLNISNFSFNENADVFALFSYCFSLDELIIKNLNLNDEKIISKIYWKCPEEVLNKIKEKLANKN